MKRLLTIGVLALAAVTALGIGGTYGANLYYAAGHGDACANCHEMKDQVDAIHSSAHRNMACTECHEAGIGTKLRHVRVHLLRRAPEQIRLREADVQTIVSDCRRCHQQEYAGWHAGPHSASYADIFLNKAHNTRRHLMDDCLRCHGMYFDGAVRNLVEPQDTRGPWRLTKPALSTVPTIPCQACHAVHSEGTPAFRPPDRMSLASAGVLDSLAIYDRREEMHFRAAGLAIPALYDGPRVLKVSPDPRQGLCYQCHAPRQPETNSPAALNGWGPQAGSGDDRTPMGVHEGLSCMSCHNGHNESARESCATCHPAMSHCGINVERMDTTFANAHSRHNVHWVKCVDCHEHGIPPVRKTVVASR